MRLYHGSNVVVPSPEIRKSVRAVDFGRGFYVTSSLEQATRWSRIVDKRNATASAAISVYEYDEKAAEGLRILRFAAPTGEWLDFVAAHRTGDVRQDDWDLVIGPVANDRTMPTLGLYLRGYLSRRAAIEQLLPQQLKDQYAFRTDLALSCLHFEGVLEP